ncbi:endothelin-1 [Lampris incognitus]|uniref:endothelin-1 n=1 Tax=Lampris incognitus TaxID=2546036 RepID=UPI0024B4E0DA|nr:endothelin-1 [Lampris incognitus]
MDLRVVVSVVSMMMCAGTWHTAVSAPAGGPTAPPARHVRTKRCSCATFLDKECVYFCHLDIIWVNTPERIVSYGLGNAPRRRRAVGDSASTDEGPRCKCLRENDNTCTNFCQLRRETSPDKVILSAGGDGCAERRCKHKLAANKAGGIKRMRDGIRKVASPLALRALLQTRLLLERWRARQRYRARAWEGENTAP